MPVYIFYSHYNIPWASKVPLFFTLWLSACSVIVLICIIHLEWGTWEIKLLIEWLAGALFFSKTLTLSLVFIALFIGSNTFLGSAETFLPAQQFSYQNELFRIYF